MSIPLTGDAVPLAGARPFGEPVVEVLGVSKRWRQQAWFTGRARGAPAVLSDVTFDAARGEIVAVLGENGAGKTTLLKIVAGWVRPDAGIVRVRRRVAYAGGERGFYYRLTARENLAFFGALDGLRAGERAARIVEAARIVDIEGELDRRYAVLSTGVRQRLTVARALMADPGVVLLDEPTRALDPVHASRLRRFIRETLAARCGKTVIVATNLVDEARELGARTAVLRAGTLEFVALPQRAVEDADVHALFGSPHRA